LNLGIATNSDEESHITMGLGEEGDDYGCQNKLSMDRSKMFSRGDSQFDILSSVNMEDNADQIFKEYEV